MGWRPPDFWDATPAEFYAAVAGWQEANGSEPEKQVDPLTYDEFLALREKLGDYD